MNFIKIYHYWCTGADWLVGLFDRSPEGPVGLKGLLIKVQKNKFVYKVNARRKKYTHALICLPRISRDFVEKDKYTREYFKTIKIMNSLLSPKPKNTSSGNMLLTPCYTLDGISLLATYYTSTAPFECNT